MSTPRLFGILVTFRRQGFLPEMLAAVYAQSKIPDVLFVVDNEASAQTRKIVEAYASSVRNGEIEYVAAPENVGPAGGWALGMERCLQDCSDDDWILTLDDNDPPRTPVDVESVFRMATENRHRDRAVGGAGVVGARFNWKSGLLQRLADDQIDGAVPVDYLAGGKVAMYSAEAVRVAGPYATELFFGAVEVEFGLRVRRAGFKILAHGGLWRERRVNSKRMQLTVRPKKTCVVHWQKYYRIRNYIYMMRRFGRGDLAMKWAFIQCIGKPLYSCFRSPRTAVRGFVQAVHAAYDGFTGRMGRRIDPPLAPPRE